MRRHVQACPACHADMDARRRLRASIRTAFDQAHELKARPEFTRKLRETLRSAALARQDLARDLRRHGGHWPRPLLGVGLAGALWARDRRASRALLRAAVGDHRYCALDFRLAEDPIPLSEAATRFDPAYRVLETLPPDEIHTTVGAARVDSMPVVSAHASRHTIFLIGDLAPSDLARLADAVGGPPSRHLA